MVRGYGWVHVADRPARPAPCAWRWERALVARAALVSRMLILRMVCVSAVRSVRRRLCVALRRREGGEYCVPRCGKRLCRSKSFDPRCDLLVEQGVEPHPGPPFYRPRAPRPRSYLEVPCLFHNVRGLAHAPKRQAYLRSVRAAFPVVGLAETNCPPSQEALWAKDWGGGRVFWSSVASPHHAGSES